MRPKEECGAGGGFGLVAGADEALDGLESGADSAKDGTRSLSITAEALGVVCPSQAESRLGEPRRGAVSS